MGSNSAAHMMGEIMQTNFQVGQKVEANGNKDCRILSNNGDSCTVRFWCHLRHIGDAQVATKDIKAA
jgi:hypothetical protein